MRMFLAGCCRSTSQPRQHQPQSSSHSDWFNMLSCNLNATHRRAFAFQARQPVVKAGIRSPPCAQLKRASHVVRAIELDFSDPDTQLSVAGLVLGLVLGLGAPAWYINRTERDEERLEELRAINRATYQETGEYMTDDEIAKIRKPKWTDRREFVDDD